MECLNFAFQRFGALSFLTNMCPGRAVYTLTVHFVEERPISTY